MYLPIYVYIYIYTYIKLDMLAPYITNKKVAELCTLQGRRAYQRQVSHHMSDELRRVIKVP